MRKLVLLFVLLFSFLNIIAQDCNLNEEARRHVARAKGYMAAAEKPEDYLDVYNEYKVAYDNAPNCPDICYNLAQAAEILCKINTQNCDLAIYWYKKYLEINPNAPDKDEIKDKIYGVEAEKEMYQKQLNQKNEQELEKWCGKWIRYFTYPSIEKEYHDDEPSLEIFISKEKSLKAKVIATYRVILAYKSSDDKKPTDTWEKEYQTIPVILENDYISIEYTVIHEIISQGGGKDHYDKIPYQEKYKLHLISPYRMEGQEWNNHPIAVKIDSFYFIKQ